jgi:hypothetical protein
MKKNKLKRLMLNRETIWQLDSMAMQNAIGRMVVNSASECISGCPTCTCTCPCSLWCTE